MRPKPDAIGPGQRSVWDLELIARWWRINR